MKIDQLKSMIEGGDFKTRHLAFDIIKNNLNYITKKDLGELVILMVGEDKKWEARYKADEDIDDIDGWFEDLDEVDEEDD
jgi:hypothetical protein